MQYSIVVPVHNEATNVQPLLAEMRRVLECNAPSEIIFVDDGSTDDTAACLQAFLSRCAGLRLIRHDRRYGQSAAIRTGVAAATSSIIVTADGDGQSDPADILRLLDSAASRIDGSDPLVFGLREGRQDGPMRRLASRIANEVRSAILRDRCPDTACGLKLFPREAFLGLPSFEGMHRFLPSLFQTYGHRIDYVSTRGRPRFGGRSKYGIFWRGVVGIADLLGVLWITQRTRRPKSIEVSAATVLRETDPAWAKDREVIS